ncbi:MAG: response regulator transcription factor [Candidatus Magnetoovum sp. WYHC-5]|nr:response regulator transcription factor [Candidatus Magnetoovum sp. WYHC-5]
MKVLLIEDDGILRESLKDYLEGSKIACHSPTDERDYVDFLATNSYDAIIIDLMLRFIKGEDILQKIRKEGLTTPILILTAKNAIEDKDVCFTLGVDDYLVKPFEPRELLLRLKALSKRHGQTLIKIGNVIADIEGQTLYRDNVEVSISKRAWSLLYLMILNRGKVVTTETIMSYVWGDSPVGDEIIRTYIKILRKILPKDTITTFKGRGYKLTI